MRFCQQNAFAHAVTRSLGLPVVVLMTLVLLPQPSSAQACWDVDEHETLTYTRTEACVEVEAGEKLVIASGVLILTGDPNDSNDPNYPCDVSTIDGEITLEDESSTLRITTNDHTFTGSGSIIGEDCSATIEIADGETLINWTTIEGCLQIVPASGASNTTFLNFGTVRADGGGTFRISPHYLDDQDDTPEESGDWVVGASGSDKLLLLVGSDELTGDFTINGGTLDIDASITTEGDLYFNCGKIEVASAVTFQAG